MKSRIVHFYFFRFRTNKPLNVEFRYASHVASRYKTDYRLVVFLFSQDSLVWLRCMRISICSMFYRLIFINANFPAKSKLSMILIYVIQMYATFV